MGDDKSNGYLQGIEAIRNQSMMIQSHFSI